MTSTISASERTISPEPDLITPEMSFEDVQFELFYLSANPDLHKMQSVYVWLDTHLLDFTLMDMRIFKADWIPILLPEYASLIDEQLQLACNLARWHANFAQSSECTSFPQEITVAMNYYAKAITIAETHRASRVDEMHIGASKLFMHCIRKWLVDSGKFEERLARARRMSRPEEFDRILGQMQALRAFCQTAEDDAVIKALYTQSKAVLLEGGQRSVNKFSSQITATYEGLRERFIPAQKSVTQLYREKLKIYRETYNEVEGVESLQNNTHQAFIDLFKNTFLREAYAILDVPPCRYDIRAMGSFARKELMPYSDLEWFILIEDEQHKDYFLRLAKLTKLMVLSLGETAATDLPVFSCLSAQNRSGLHFDSGSVPDYTDWIALPESLAQIVRPIDKDTGYHPQNSGYTLMRSLSLDSSDSKLFEEYAREVDQVLPKASRQHRAEELYKRRLAMYNKAWDFPLQKQEQIDIKTQFIEPIAHFLSDFALYHGIMDVHNPRELVDRFPDTIYTPNEKALLKESLEIAYRVRMRLHIAYGEQKDKVNWEKHEEGLMTLTASERAALLKSYLLVIRPIYNGGMHASHLIEEAFKLLSIHSYGVYDADATRFIAMSLTDPEEIRHIFERLGNQPSMESLRSIFISGVADGDLREELLDTPSASGVRVRFALEEERFHKSLETLLAKEGEVTQIKVTIPGSERPYYLHKDVIKQFLDPTGHVQQQYPGSLHNVARVLFEGVDVHFKEKPGHAMMEHAIHLFNQRLSGSGASQGILWRFDVTVGRVVRSYPILISETFRGIPLENDAIADQVNNQSRTWHLLSAILTRPGDGRASNYLVNQEGNLKCIDNDIAFVEPIVSERKEKRVLFASILFCMRQDIPLSSEVLDAFVHLNPASILLGWLETLVKMDEKYVRLFSENEKQLLYCQDGQNSVTLSLLFKYGAIATTYHQFIKLQKRIQHALRENKPLYPKDLLSAIVTITDSGEEEVGSLVERAYRRANKEKKLKERFYKVTQRASGLSMSSRQAIKSSLGVVPSATTVIERKEYSAEIAMAELGFVAMKELDKKGKVGKQLQSGVLNPHFESMSRHGTLDLSRQRIVLNVILSNIDPLQIKELRLAGGAVLTAADLEKLIHPHLEVIDLQGISTLSEELLYLIFDRLIVAPLDKLRQMVLQVVNERRKSQLDIRSDQEHIAFLIDMAATDAKKIVDWMNSDLVREELLLKTLCKELKIDLEPYLPKLRELYLDSNPQLQKIQLDPKKGFAETLIPLYALDTLGLSKCSSIVEVRVNAPHLNRIRLRDINEGFKGNVHPHIFDNLPVFNPTFIPDETRVQLAEQYQLLLKDYFIISRGLNLGGIEKGNEHLFFPYVRNTLLDKRGIADKELRAMLLQSILFADESTAPESELPFEVPLHVLSIAADGKERRTLSAPEARALIASLEQIGGYEELHIRGCFDQTSIGSSTYTSSDEMLSELRKIAGFGGSNEQFASFLKAVPKENALSAWGSGTRRLLIDFQEKSKVPLTAIRLEDISLEPHPSYSKAASLLKELVPLVMRSHKELTVLSLSFSRDYKDEPLNSYDVYREELGFVPKEMSIEQFFAEVEIQSFLRLAYIKLIGDGFCFKRNPFEKLHGATRLQSIEVILSSTVDSLQGIEELHSLTSLKLEVRNDEGANLWHALSACKRTNLKEIELKIVGGSLSQIEAETIRRSLGIKASLAKIEYVACEMKPEVEGLLKKIGTTA